MQKETQFDCLVIGAGPGGYVAAIRSAQLGMNTAIVEREDSLGGTCLNWGCIPSKALLDSSEKYHQARHEFSDHGIEVKGVKVDFVKMMARKTKVVLDTTKGIEFLMDKNKITVFKGQASFKDAHTVLVGDQEVSARHIVIATGSSVTPLPTVPEDGKRIISSKEALELKKIPIHLIVIGGGVIGVELGSVYARLGSKVTVVEFMDRLIPGMDEELGKQLQRSLKKLDMTFHLGTKVTGAKTTASAVIVTAEDKSGQTIELEGDYVLVSIGRRPNTDGLNLEAIGVTLGQRGDIPVNEYFQTTCPSVYAIGDVIKGPMLAHKASEEGVACVEGIAGHHGHLNYLTIPSVVYTWPEVASVGYTEDQLKGAGRAYKTGKFPFKASGRARASNESDGFVKVLADASTDEILGVHMIGPRCSDMIAQAGLALEYRASAEDVGIMMHAHPSFSEAMKEAALAATGNRALHI